MAVDQFTNYWDSSMVWGMIMITLGWITVLSFKRYSMSSQLPLLNDRQLGEVLYIRAKKRFAHCAAELIHSGYTKYPMFRIVTDKGPKLILSAKYIDDIRNDDRLSPTEALEIDECNNIPGLEAVSTGRKQPRIFNETMAKMTQSLPRMIEPLAEETALALQQHWTNQSEWHEIGLFPSLIEVVAHAVARMFVGPSLCRNKSWIRLTISYSTSVFMVSQSLHLWPRFLRVNIIHWFLPSCRKLRAQVREAQSMITPLVEGIRKEKAVALEHGQLLSKGSNGLEWMEESASGEKYDPAITQLSFAVAAIHTSTDFLMKVILDLCLHSELVPPLRAEIISAFKQDGWSKQTLAKLKLLDSVMKESQRLKPAGTYTMRRIATSKVRLHDGTEIPAGTALAVSLNHMQDSAVYPDATNFDGYRFLKLREMPNQEHKAQFVSTSVDHMGFSYGKHACPGRFLAASEVKIVLCQLLIKYDWRLVGHTDDRTNGIFNLADYNARIAIKRRQEEIPL